MKPGYKQTEVGVIPEEWEVQRLGSVGHWFSGGTPSMANDLYWNGDIPWVSAKDMKVSRLLDSLLHVTEKAIGNGTRIAPAGAVLIVVRGMILAHTFPVAVATRPVAFNQDMKALVARAGIDSEFILVWLQASAKGILGITSESTHGTKRLASDDLFSTKVGVPPLPEQTAIATALSDVDGLLGGLDRLIAKKRDLKQAAMQQLLTGQTRLPGFSGEWEVKRLGTLLRFQVGFPFSSSFFNEKGEGIRLVKNRDLKSDDQVFHYNGKYEEAFVVRDGDVLIGMDGDFLPCQWNKGPALLNQRVGRAVQNSGLNVAFAFYALIEPLKEIEIVTSSTTVKHLSHGDVEGIERPLPELPEQTAIASVLTEMDAELVALTQRRDKTRALKQAMMQELLTGRTRLV